MFPTEIEILRALPRGYVLVEEGKVGPRPLLHCGPFHWRAQKLQKEEGGEAGNGGENGADLSTAKIGPLHEDVTTGCESGFAQGRRRMRNCSWVLISVPPS